MRLLFTFHTTIEKRSKKLPAVQTWDTTTFSLFAAALTIGCMELLTDFSIPFRRGETVTSIQLL